MFQERHLTETLNMTSLNMTPFKARQSSRECKLWLSNTNENGRKPTQMLIFSNKSTRKKNDVVVFIFQTKYKNIIM